MPRFLFFQGGENESSIIENSFDRFLFWQTRGVWFGSLYRGMMVNISLDYRDYLVTPWQ
jgi:hypothetical protein